MPRVRGIAESAVDRLAAGWQRADMLARCRALGAVDRHRVTVGEVSTAMSGRHVVPPYSAHPSQLRSQGEAAIVDVQHLENRAVAADRSAPSVRVCRPG